MPLRFFRGVQFAVILLGRGLFSDPVAFVPFFFFFFFYGFTVLRQPGPSG